ncbi:MAG TPA: aldehyde dehydrogenase family protein [Solirubrobacteraceae bacterium]|jgi:acyl-CoA reductase-like NAD-dependent aldehyde dehydrogenase|nr:aldehyde dehydrogenase family protein [Solirubrobacteraceae bacterium]
MASVEQHVEQEILRAGDEAAQASAETPVEQAPVEAAAPAAGEIPVENPATGETVRTVPDLGAAAVAEMAARGRAAQPQWEAYGFEGRARVLLRAQKWLMDNAQRVAETIVSETGKTYEDANLAEIGYAGNAFGFWAKHGPEYLADESVKSSQVLVKGKKLILRYRPLGLIGVIGPWNYPLTNSFGDCIPALMAGNSVILKPSEVTPLTSLLMAEGLRECGLPDDVLQIATGRGETGAALIEHVDMIMFTGSTKTGRKVAEAAARRLIPASLELGGKDPMIVLSDADLERAANFAAYFSMQNAGQTCISIERVYVEEPVYDEFVAKVTEKVRALRVGNPDGGFGTVEVGAITFPPQLDTIKDHVADAVQKGARVLTGGQQAPGPGRFYEPTVLVDVDHTMKCMTEETFGPTLPIMKVADADEAVRLANDSPYGLGASVFSRDAARGEAVARRIDAGAANVNDAMINYTVLELPMGGAKTSGIGSRHGAGGIRKYCSQQAIVVTAKMAMKKELFMFPYKSRTSRMLAGAFKLMYGRGKRD